MENSGWNLLASTFTLLISLTACTQPVPPEVTGIEPEGLAVPAATGNTYTISPSDSFSKYFTTDTSKRLKPGDTLVLKDGNYGKLAINCKTNANNGTSTARITIKAQNERKAHLQGAG